jgi:hypothetical protein
MGNPVINDLGTSRWFHANGYLHRDDGPAIIYEDGTKIWLQHNKRHLDDGPAVEWGNGGKSWWQRGKCHRVDGPAVELPDGSTLWYLNDRRMSFDEWLNEVIMSNEDKVMMKLKYG